VRAGHRRPRRCRRSLRALVRSLQSRRADVRRADAGGAPLPPSEKFWLGTDLLGRDLFSRILFGARTSLIIGIVANGAALLIGTLIGVTAGYFRGWIGGALMRFTDLMMAFPALLLAICLAAVFQPSLWIVALVIALVNWVQTARIIFTETSSLAEREFIDAERTIGASTPHPAAPHPAASFADDHRLGHARHLDDSAPGGDAFLSRDRRAAAHGLVGQHHLREPDLFSGRALAGVLSGAAILALALAFNLVGDALRDILDPTQRGRA
jgi:peptide/nickel transport system permease protein